MDVNELTLLVEILDAGNLSEAARRLKMSRANVSYHLNQLEKSVGLQLVRRTTRRVEPTELGLASVVVQNTAPWTYLGDRPIDACPDASFDTGLDEAEARALQAVAWKAISQK